MAREGREVWAKRVERWRDSGLTAKEFAAETGVNAKTLAYWRWQLAGGTRRARAKEPAQVRFVELAAGVPSIRPVNRVPDRRPARWYSLPHGTRGARGLGEANRAVA